MIIWNANKKTNKHDFGFLDVNINLYFVSTEGRGNHFLWDYKGSGLMWKYYIIQISLVQRISHACMMVLKRPEI